MQQNAWRQHGEHVSTVLPVNICADRGRAGLVRRLGVRAVGEEGERGPGGNARRGNVIFGETVDGACNSGRQRRQRKRQKKGGKKTDKDDETEVTKTTLRENFTYMDVNLYAKDTCLNWFYKIACIRELLPRLFIELSLFKCWRFVRPASDYPKILKRLARIIRGIGDPLVAAYARAYWVHRGFEICGDSMRPSLLETFDDFLFVFNEIEKYKFQNIPAVVSKKITESDYIDLYSPALDWIIQCIGYKAREEEFFGLLQRYKDGWNNSIILLHILSQFESSYISKHCKTISTLIKESVVTTVERSKLYKELGRSIVKCAPPPNIRLEILNEIWKVVSKIIVAKEYVEVASVYIEYILQHFTKSEIDILLNDVIKHLKKDLGLVDLYIYIYIFIYMYIYLYISFRELQEEIYKIVCHILHYVKDFKVLFEINNFLPLIDMLENTNKMNACKMVLECFVRSNYAKANMYEESKENMKSSSGISDAVLIHSLLEVSRMLHDSIDHLTLADDRKQISEMIIHVIDCIDYGVDLERQLNEYVECRSMFSNLDSVIYNLVTKVGDMAMKAYRFMQGKHDKKTSAFVKVMDMCLYSIFGLYQLFEH
ncbi:hypothetical protein RFI_15900 [Reticulomyxa filosa]|uniref:Uncharacterized protein n=1 Tax=Reticulomyxa filosa TaxID=46433 RepID=X6N6B9_RETFI|nr:hypothetical protein RFI_15900 [Reticulomyxa filosa]|eukprot:ETO21304.1 hypothetical protein RFI_15900 [Reticulomyxa filosa]